jgi:hypothetical protein
MKSLQRTTGCSSPPYLTSALATSQFRQVYTLVLYDSFTEKDRESPRHSMLPHPPPMSRLFFSNFNFPALILVHQSLSKLLSFCLPKRTYSKIQEAKLRLCKLWRRGQRSSSLSIPPWSGGQGKSGPRVLPRCYCSMTNVRTEWTPVVGCLSRPWHELGRVKNS